MSKVLQVFYGKDNLPYKDKELQVHFPIVGQAFQGSSQTNAIKFYIDNIGDEDTTWVAVAKLPNGQIGFKQLSVYNDDNGNYAYLQLSNWFTQYKGDLYINLQGYAGGIEFVEDEETHILTPVGDPIIEVTGSVKLTISYATQIVDGGEMEVHTLQEFWAILGTKLGIRAYSEHVEELPSEGSPDVFYVINDDSSNPNLANIYIWNENTRHYIWVGDNTLDLGNYYTNEQGDQFEEEIDNRVTSVENELSSVAQGSPKGVYATLSDLENAYPSGTTGIYVVSANGHWYYWNGSAWIDGGAYLSVQNAVSHSGTRLKDENGENLFPDISGIPFYPTVRIGQKISFSISSGNIIVTLPTSPNQLFYAYGGKCYFVNLGANNVYTIPSFYALIWDYDDKALYVKNFNTNSEELIGYTHQYCILLLNDNGNIKGLWEDYYKIEINKDTIQEEINSRLSNPVLPSTVAPRLNYESELKITKNGTDLIVDLPSSIKQIAFIRNGVFRTFDYTNTQITIPNFFALVLNVNEATFSVLDTNQNGNKPLENYNKLYYVLLYNDNGYPKGEWAKYYEYNKLNIKPKYTEKIMSRQGEGYGYPDNSIEGVSAALKDGYNNVRISVAHTSDNVIYCTHSHEMQHNADYHVLTINGVAYNDNVDINNSTSTFIDTLKYKGYTIPKLADMMSVISKNAKQVTFELKDSWDNTNLQTLINIAKYYSVEVVFSMSIDSTPTLLTNLDDNLNIALIFHYTDTSAQTLYNSYKNKSKSIRFDCYYEDTISFDSVITYIHPNCKLKLGGSSITSTQLKEYLTYLDVVEYSGKISEIGEL